ncbi:hypothetical protein [Altererythrobacter lauratis]|uniref:LPXTG cell wall anchor domain-containing protein n=1 Tax=Alteraurantiacibacter lauratis TaxID=2054627 RepID=A0ABV7ECN5_9SPHN
MMLLFGAGAAAVFMRRRRRGKFGGETGEDGTREAA